MEFKTNAIYCGDCKNILSQFPEESVDLIYVDPPFFSNKKYEVIWGDGYELRAFEDRWEGGSKHYIGWMEDRIRECHYVLKNTGSMYLHCDWHANAHLRMLMDEVFESNNFRNEIIWNKGFRGTERKKNWQQAHDTIFFYTKSNDYTWNQQFQSYADASLKRYNKVDSSGKHYARIKRRRADGSIYYGKTYPNKQGKRINDVVSIPILAATAKERLCYPTQKPETLLENFINASSNEGDIVLDPMCGCGTCTAVARKLKRQWIGIDVFPTACKLIVSRMQRLEKNKKRLKVLIKDEDIIGLPRILEEIKLMEPFEFQNWVCEKLSGRSSNKMTGDFGIDGWSFGMPLQVKQSEHGGRNIIDNFETAIRRAKKDKGIVIAFSFSRGSYEEVARTKQDEGLNIELKTVEEILKEE